jgi:hypothetical protein
MQLEKIITLANENTRLRFLAMERSLRATGCTLPLWVIPYDDNTFELPPNAVWWQIETITNWLNGKMASKPKRKYQCMLEDNYQFVDADIVFLKNPESVLTDLSGFITSCGHWHNPWHTYTPDSLTVFKQRSTTWQQHIFNSGQFACDKNLYNSIDSLIQTAERDEYKEACLDFSFHDQPGLNLLVNITDVQVINLTLQPYYMQSTWAGDYPDADYERYWQNEARKPYLIHWAGCNMNIGRPIDQLFLNYLSDAEKAEWHQQVLAKAAVNNTLNKRFRKQLRKIKKAVKLLTE